MATSILVGGMALAAQGLVGQALAAPALPSGGQVVAGQAAINASGGKTVISQSSDKAIINWTDFSIGQGGEVDINNGSGATLNRVTGTSLSSIDGLLKATGSVYLINPNGVIIGKDGVVRVGGSFVASALDMSNDNFLNGGDQTFAGSSLASVVNLGKIGALGGDVALMAVNVQNSGKINAAGGTAGLIAGHKIIMRDSSVNDGKFLVVTGGADTSLTNDGAIKAASAELRAEGGNIYALAGNTQGVIRATGVTATDGKVFLTAGTGSVKVSGSTIAASDAAGNGGAISVTGQTVDVAADATLDASATAANGSGGHIDAIADMASGQLNFQGTALAKGGTAGGRVETSGASVNFDGAHINTTATDGLSGNWLVDPADLIVDSSAAETISTNLASTGVTLQTTETSASGPGTTLSGGNGDIIILAPINWSSANTLTLDAYHSINISAPITVSGAGGAVLTTNNGGTGGDYSFDLQGDGFHGGLNFTGTGGSLTINGDAYTLLYSLSDLQDISGNAGHYALATTLDASSAGTYTFSLITTLDSGAILTGLGHTVNHLAISASSYGGLIGKNVGTVRDIGMQGGTVSGLSYTGGLIGYNYSAGKVSSVYVSNTVSGTSYAGGLIGYNLGAVSTAYATGAVSGRSAVGGLIGYHAGGTVTYAYATGAVTGSSRNRYIGGLIGEMYNGTVSNTYATGAVNSDLSGSYAGGLIGYNPAGEVTSSYATGAATGPIKGGAIGSGGSTVTNVYYDSSTTGQTDTGKGIGQTTAQLQGTLPSGFDSSVWGTDTGLYPYLKAFGTVTSYQKISGYAYNADGSEANAATVGIYSGGASVGLSGATGANGYYYIIAAPGTATSSSELGAALTLNGASNVSGLSYTNAPSLSSGDVVNFNVRAGLIDTTTSATSYTGLQTGLSDTFGASTLSAALANISNPDNKITASGAFTLDADLTGGGAVAIKTGGDLTLSNAITVNGSSALTLDSHDNLYVNANINASGSDAVTLTTADGGSGDYYFALDGSLSFTGSGGSLNINGNAYTLISDMATLDGLDGYNAVSDTGTAISVSGYYALAKSLDAAGTTYTGPLIDDDSAGHTFSGIFTGLGHTISNLTITIPVNADNFKGMFGNNSGTLRDLGLVGGVIQGRYIAPLAGANSGTIKNVFSSATVTGTGTEEIGVAGLVVESSGTISNSFATGAITGGDYAGGLILLNNGTVTNTYATGAVYGTVAAGGLIAINSTPDIVSNSYATGLVAGTTGKGGLIGEPDSGTITNSYYDSGTTGQSDTGNGLAQTTSQLQGSLPSGFSSSVWATGTGLYPYLKTFYPNGLQAISGTAKDSSGSAVAAADIGVYAGGNLLGNGSSGANGYYYALVAPGSVSSATDLGGALTLSGAASVSGLTYTDTPTLTSGNVTGFDIRSGLINVTTAVTSYSGLQSAMSAAYGATNWSGLLSSIGSPDYKIAATGSFNFDQATNFAAGLDATASGGLTLSQNLTTAGATSFNSAFTLGGDVTVHDTAGNIDFASTIDGTHSLNANASGTITFDGNIGAVTALSSLTTTGNTYLHNNSVTTSGAQTYNGAVTLGRTVTLASTSSGNIGFSSTIDGAYGLTVNTAGTSSFGGVIGGTTALNRLQTDAGGTTQLGGNVTTTLAQIYGEAVTLSADASLTSNSTGGISFGNTLNGAHNLTVNTSSFSTFSGAVGATTALASLTTNAGGTTKLGGNVTTSGAQTYNDAVSLQANSTLTAGDALTTGSTVNGSYSLTLVGTSLNLDAAIGGTTALTSLTGTANAGNISVGGQMTTSGNIMLAADGSFANTAGSSALNADGSFTVYTQNAADPTGTMPVNTLDGLTATNYYNDAFNFTNGTFASSVPTGNHFVYGYAASLTPTLSGSASKTYNATITATTSGLSVSHGSLLSVDDSVTLTIGSAVFDTKNAGTSKTVTANIGFSSNPNNYTLSSTAAVAAIGTISKAALTLAAATDAKTYDATTPSTGSVGVTGLQGSDTVTDLSQSFDSRNAGSRTLGVNGGYTVNDGNSGGNYTVTTQDASGTISRAALTLAAATDTKTYDATTTSSGTVSVSGLQGSDTVTGLGQSFDAKNAGSRTLSVNSGYMLNDGNSGGNYTVSITTASGTISRAALTLAAATDTKTYDATTTSTGTLGVSGLQGTDTVTGATQAFDSKNAGSRTLLVNGGYTVNDGNSGGNYTVNTTTASGSIFKAALTASLTGSVIKTYDATADAHLTNANYILSGVISGDAAVLNDPVAGTYADQNAGTGKTVSVSGLALSGADAGNYTFNSRASANIGVIQSRAITVTADNISKFSGASDPALTWKITLGDLIGGDTLTGGLTRDTGEAPGNYAISQGSLAASANYNIAFNGAIFSITPVALQNQPLVNPVQNIVSPPPPPPPPAPQNGASGDTGSGSGGGNENADGPTTDHGSSSSGTCVSGEACSNQPYPGNQSFSSYVSFLSH